MKDKGRAKKKVALLTEGDMREKKIGEVTSVPLRSSPRFSSLFAHRFQLLPYPTIATPGIGYFLSRIVTTMGLAQLKNINASANVSQFTKFT